MCTLIRYLGFIGIFSYCSVGCFSMIVWTAAVLSVLCGCVLYFCIYTCSAQLSMFHMERRSRNTLILVSIILIISTFIQGHKNRKKSVSIFSEISLSVLVKFSMSPQPVGLLEFILFFF